MHELVVVGLKVIPINVGEAVRLYQDRVVPAAREQEGLRGALLLTNPDTGEGLSISMWNSEEGMHASEVSGYYHRRLSELDALFISTPVRKHDEVSAQG